MPGHRCVSHARTRPSSRSRGRRSGTCGVYPRRASQSLRYRWFIRTPRCPSMTAATRGAVHRSVTNPNSHGLWSSQPRTAAACVSDSFGGRPPAWSGCQPGLPARPPGAEPPPHGAFAHSKQVRDLVRGLAVQRQRNSHVPPLLHRQHHPWHDHGFDDDASSVLLTTII